MSQAPNLYTVMLDFDDHTLAIEQFDAESPEQALKQFVDLAGALESYDRKKISDVVSERIKAGNILLQVANMKGVWLVNFGAEFFDCAESAILGGRIVQTDTTGPIRE